MDTTTKAAAEPEQPESAPLEEAAAAETPEARPEQTTADMLLQAGEEALTRLRDERAALTAQNQLREIRELDREVSTLEDLMDMPEYGQYYALVKKGLSLVEAYKLIHHDRLVQRAAEAAARQTARSMGSRGHMAAMGGQHGAGELTTVPAEIAAEYRLAKPGISDREIRRRYQQYKKYKRQ